VASRFEELARSALAEITDPANVGDWIEDRPRESEDGVVDVVYASAQPGYRGWSWIVSVAALPDEPPSVLELGQLPGDEALLAPEWIPWSVRLAEWQAQQRALAAAGEADDGDGGGDESDDEDDDLDEEDLDEEGLDDDFDDEDILDAGDLDGVDLGEDADEDLRPDADGATEADDDLDDPDDED